VGAVVVVVVATGDADGSEDLGGAVDAGLDVQVGVLEIDAGVDHGNVHVHAIVVGAVDVDRCVGVSEDALDAGGYVLGIDVDLAVLLHVLDPRVVAEGVEPALRHLGGHALQRVLVGEAHLEAVGLGHVRHGGPGVDGVLEHHDVGAHDRGLGWQGHEHEAGEQPQDHELDDADLVLHCCPLLPGRRKW